MTRLATSTGLKRLSLAFAILVTGLLTVGDAAAQDRRVRVINDTNTDMREFYASNVNEDSWQEDILGSGYLYAGDSVVIDIDDGTGACLFDFKAVFVDGDELIDNDINVCRIESYRYHN